MPAAAGQVALRESPVGNIKKYAAARIIDVAAAIAVWCDFRQRTLANLATPLKLRRIAAGRTRHPTDEHLVFVRIA